MYCERERRGLRGKYWNVCKLFLTAISLYMYVCVNFTCHAGCHMVPEGAGYSDGLETDQPLVLVGTNVVLLVCVCTLSQSLYLQLSPLCCTFYYKMGHYLFHITVHCMHLGSLDRINSNCCESSLFLPSLAHSLMKYTHSPTPLHRSAHSCEESALVQFEGKFPRICLALFFPLSQLTSNHQTPVLCLLRPQTSCISLSVCVCVCACVCACVYM